MISHDWKQKRNKSPSQSGMNSIFLFSDYFSATIVSVVSICFRTDLGSIYTANFGNK